MKTFTVRNADGTTQVAEHLGFFSYLIEGAQYRFVVTQTAGEYPAVTHKASGTRFATVQPAAIAAALGDYIMAGKAALDVLIASKGAEQVRMDLAEAQVDVLNRTAVRLPALAA